MAMKNSPDPNYQERIARKKKVVNELLALRRMKYMQNKSRGRPVHSPSTGRVYEAYKVVADLQGPLDRASVSREQVRDLMKGTTLEKELYAIYGDDAIVNAAEHYTNLLSGSYNRGKPDEGGSTSENKGESDTLQKRLFLHKLIKERRARQEAKMQKRHAKEQSLLQQKENIQIAKSKLKAGLHREDEHVSDGGVSSDSSEENMDHFVDEVKQKISSIEKGLKLLKQQQKAQVKTKKAFTKPPAIDYSFKPWQQEQVDIAKGIVEDMISKALDVCVSSDDHLASTLLEVLLQKDNEQWEQMTAQGLKYDAMVDILDELIDEVCAVMVCKTAEECQLTLKLTHVLSSDLVINSTYNVLYGKVPKTNDVQAKLIDQAWVEMVTRRDKTRRPLWGHTQSVISSVPVTSAVELTEPKKPVEDTEGDVIPVSYEQVPLKHNILIGPEWEAYANQELEFWKSADLSLTTGPVSLSYRKIIGISCLAISYDNKLIALGCFRGDILVYDIMWQPFRPVACVSYIGKKPDRIVDIGWTYDRARILTLSETFCLIVWSVSFPSPFSSSDVRHLGLPEDKVDDYQCQQLTALVMLEAQIGDFSIKEGSLSASLTSNPFSTPVTAKFSPNFNVAGTQNFIVVGFASGDILQCDLSTKITSRYIDLLQTTWEELDPPFISGQGMLTKGNKISNNIPVELFRYHRHPVLLILFTANNGDMVTMDEKLNIGQWKHNKDQLTGFKWFTPFRKLKLSGDEIVMSPKGPENLLFEDEITLKKPVKGRKRKGKQVIERERREVNAELRTLQLQLRKPWHSDDQDLDDDEKKKKTSKFVTRTYAPTKEEIVDPLGSQTFHIITKQRSTNLVVKYATRTYQATSTPCKALVDFYPSRDGNRIYFMFLHEKHPPNIKAHVTFVDLDLLRLDMLQSSVIRLEMDKEQYDRCVTKREAGFTVSRKYLSTMSEYIYCNLAGRMHILSTLTGSTVAQCAPEKKTKKKEPENGLELPAKLSKLTNRLNLSVLCPDGDRTYLLILTQAEDYRSEAVSGMFTVDDASTSDQRRMLTHSNRQLLGLDPTSDPQTVGYTEDNPIHYEQCIQNQKYTVRNMPTALYVQMTLNSLIDNAVAVATGVRMTKEQRKALWDEDWKKMQAFFSHSGKEPTLETT